MRAPFTPSTLLVLSIVALGGCDEPGIASGSDTPTVIETGSFAGFDGGLDTDAMGAPSDAAVSVASDASLPPGDAGGAFDPSCTPADCGAMPSSQPTCFDGTTAVVECATWVDGTCSWQFVCGL